MGRPHRGAPTTAWQAYKIPIAMQFARSRLGRSRKPEQPGQPMKKEQWNKIQTELDEIQKENEGKTFARAVAAINTFRYTALRQFHYRQWPAAGEIRDELDKLDKLPLYELDELLDLAGLQTQQRFDANQAVMIAQRNGPKPIK